MWISYTPGYTLSSHSPLQASPIKFCRGLPNDLVCTHQGSEQEQNILIWITRWALVFYSMLMSDVWRWCFFFFFFYILSPRPFIIPLRCFQCYVVSWHPCLAFQIYCTPGTAPGCAKGAVSFTDWCVLLSAKSKVMELLWMCISDKRGIGQTEANSRGWKAL